MSCASGDLELAAGDDELQRLNYFPQIQAGQAPYGRSAAMLTRHFARFHSVITCPVSLERQRRRASHAGRNTGHAAGVAGDAAGVTGGAGSPGRSQTRWWAAAAAAARRYAARVMGWC